MLFYVKISELYETAAAKEKSICSEAKQNNQISLQDKSTQRKILLLKPKKSGKLRSPPLSSWKENSKLLQVNDNDFRNHQHICCTDLDSN
jgi:hypothetical protein